MEKYYLWRCQLKKKFGELYICRNHNTKKIFGFQNIIIKYSSLSIDLNYWVSGKYSGNTDIILVSGENKTIPVLSNVYLREIVD